uniref:Uncharacterized protein n=1 Tax=Rhizophora mucronata TaxID=61149 RepID=A0A2P2QEW6_RHIMU
MMKSEKTLFSKNMHKPTIQLIIKSSRGLQLPKQTARIQ